MELQQYYEAKIKLEAERRKFHPNLSILRNILFWDTDINRIDWEKHSKFVIQRVFERGNEAEKEEITRFYGLEKVNAVLSQKFPTGKIHVMGHLKVRYCLLYWNTVDDLLKSSLVALMNAEELVSFNSLCLSR